METANTQKFIIAFDTIVDGEQTSLGENEAPTLYDTREEAVVEMFDENLSMLESHLADGMLEEYNEGVTPEMIDEMHLIMESGDTVRMERFLVHNPNCNDAGTWVVAADDFTLGRKTIYTGQ